MKRFMAVYTGNPAAIEGYGKRFASEDERKANDRKGMEAWMQWAQKRMFLDHPHFTIFPGDGVEIMECLPVPQRG